MRTYRFRADVHVESNAHDGALPVLAGWSAPAPEATPGLLAAVGRGADYLARVMNAEGRYVYMYRPVEDHDDPTYGWLRHAGTTYALLEAYEERHADVPAEGRARARVPRGAHRTTGETGK